MSLYPNIAGALVTLRKARDIFAIQGQESMVLEMDEVIRDFKRADPWQDIQSAPKDRAILICGGTYDMPSNWGAPLPFTGVCIAIFNSRKEWQGDDISHDEWNVHYPTHWMSVPSPVQTSAT